MNRPQIDWDPPVTRNRALTALGVVLIVIGAVALAALSFRLGMVMR